MNSASNQNKARKCAGGCGRKVMPPTRKCPACRKQAARSARQRRGSGGGWHRGGAAARVLSYSSPIGPINPSACPQPEAECRFCGFPVSRCYCTGRTKLADLAGELDVLCVGQERFAAGHPGAHLAQSPFAARLADVMDRIEAQL